MTRKSMGRATTAGLSIAAVAALGFGATPLAFSQDKTQCEAFDASKTVNLTINKRDGAEGAEGNGLTANPGGKELNDVTFKVTKIEGLDVTTNAGQQKIAELAKKYKDSAEKVVSEDGVSLGAAQEVTTSGAGQAKLENLAPGMYLVEEISAPDGYIKSKPVLVALPLTNPTEKNCWNYDVQLYPKNSKVGLTKDVKDSTTPGSGNQTEDAATQGGTNENSRVTYTIDSTVPNKELKRYRIVDPIDVRAAYVEGSAVVTLSDGTALTKDVDYKIISKAANPVPEKPAPDTADVVPGHFLTVEFLEPGLTKLSEQAKKAAEAEEPTELKVNLTFNVDIDPTQGLTAIPNKALLFPTPPNEGTEDWDPENPGDVPPPPTDVPPTPTVTTYYGKLKFAKVDANDSEKKLKDAKFQVFECDADKVLADTPVKVGDKGEFISADASGEVVIDGLLVNDWRNNSATDASDDNKEWVTKSFYCLKEVQAPEGYELLPEPVQFQILKDGSVKFEKNGKLEAAGPDLTLANVPKNNGFNLPLTGGAGIAPLVVVGGLLIAGSGAYVAAASRRKKQA